jgi:hypothetical protein
MTRRFLNGLSSRSPMLCAIVVLAFMSFMWVRSYCVYDGADETVS